MLLITKQDIENYRNCKLSVRDEIVNPFIKNAQNEDLRKLLGNELFFDVLKNENNKYNDLLGGCEFTVNENSYKHEGLKAVLSDFTYARFIIHGSLHVTDFGFVEKSNQDSKPVSTNHRRDIKKMAEQSAHSKFELVKMYMTESRILRCKKINTRRRRIRKI